MNSFYELWELIKANITALLSTDSSVVQFKHSNFAVEAAMILIAAFLLKIFWPNKNKSSYVHSGHRFENQDKPGFWDKAIALSPVMFAFLGSGFLLLAIADPYVLYSQEFKTAQSREMVYLEDASVSMGFGFGGQHISRAEIVRDFISRLIAERREKNDKSAFVIYATNPYRIADFTTDTNSLLFSVENGPLVIADPRTPSIELYKGIFIVKDFMKENFGGESDLFLGLEAVNKLFDEKGDPDITKEIKNNPTIKRRSVIIATDGASSRDPEPQFKELAKRGIVPFLVYIDPDKNAERNIHGDDSPEIKLPETLLRQVKLYGGEYFIAANRPSLNQIRQRLDRLHAAIGKSKSYTAENHIYRLPLVASLLLYSLAIMARSLFRFHLTV